MQLSDWNILSEEEQKQISEFIIENVETIYDTRSAFGARIDPLSRHLNVLYDETIKDEFVEERFVGFWCNECKDWTELSSDIGLVEHVLKHIRGEPLEDDVTNKLRDELLDYARAVDELHTHTSVDGD